jgi:hypothetical protein
MMEDIADRPTQMGQEASIVEHLADGIVFDLGQVAGDKHGQVICFDNKEVANGILVLVQGGWPTRQASRSGASEPVASAQMGDQ